MLHVQSACSYGFMSIVMVLANKYLLSIWKFDYIIFLILIEMLINIAVIGMLNYRAGKSLFDFKFDKRMKNLAIGSFFYTLHSVLSLKALNGLNIPIYTVFKRCVPLVNLVLSFVLIDEKKDIHLVSSAEYARHSKQITASILLMTSGVLIAGFGELTFDFYSYSYCGLSVICQGLYLTFIQKCSDGPEKDSIKTLYEVSIITIPLLLTFFMFSDEAQNMTSAESKFSFDNISFLFTFLLVLLSGCLLSFSQVWCTVNNNAITTSVVGILKSIIQTFCGIIIFNAWKNLTLFSYIGLLFNFVFGGWYTYLKYIEKDVRRGSVDKLPFLTPNKFSAIDGLSKK